MTGRLKAFIAASCLAWACSSYAQASDGFDDAKEALGTDWTWTGNSCRQSVCLNGDWDFLPLGRYAGDGSKPETLVYPPSGAWKTKGIRVPASWNNFSGEFDFPKYGSFLHKAWYRKSFALPESMNGQRVILDFKEISYDASVYVNGKFAGFHRGCFVGFQVDATELVKPAGQPNTLEIGVVNWVNAINSNMIEYPINGSCTYRSGILQDVFLRGVPKEARVVDVFIIPSVRKGELSAKLTISNQGPSERKIVVENEVLPWRSDELSAQIAKSFEKTELVLKPGETREIETRAPWKDARLWTPDDPWLYQLRTTLVCDGKIADRAFTRFGFREFYVEGSEFMLNGVPFKLLGCADDTIQSTCAPEMASYVRAYYAMLKRSDVRVLRAYMPLPDVYLQIADEAGIMLIDGTCIVTNARSLENLAGVKLGSRAATADWVSDGVFYSYRQNEALLDVFFKDKTIERRNHPSIAMFCMQNEGVAAGEDFARKISVVRQFDGTRPIVSSGSGDAARVGSFYGPTGAAKAHCRGRLPDMDGLSDALTQHYPVGYGGSGAYLGPKFFFPGMLYIYDKWFKLGKNGEKIKLDLLDLGPQTEVDELFRESATTGKRKPLYFSEVPSPEDTPDMIAFIYGDKAYGGVYDRQNGSFHHCAADAGRQQLEAFRYYGAEGVLYFPGPDLGCGIQPNYRFKWKRLDAPGLHPDNILTGGGYLRVNPFNSQTTVNALPGHFSGSSYKPEVIPGQAARCVREAFSPLFLHLREADRSFFAGREIVRTVTVANDTSIKRSLSLRWSVVKNGETLVSGSKELQLDPGATVHERLLVKTPDLGVRSPVKFRFELLEGSCVKREIERDCEISPDRVPSASRPWGFSVAAVDDDGSVKALLDKLGVSAAHVDAKDFAALDFKSFDLVVVRGFPGIEKRFDEIKKRVSEGGKFVFFGALRGQTQLPGLNSDEQKVSIVFPLMKSHPVLKGIGPDDLKWWSNPYQVVACSSFLVPESGDIELLACNGKNSGGLNHTPLFVSRSGEGFLLACSLVVPEAFDDTPPARALAANILNFAFKTPKNEFSCAGVMAGEGSKFPSLLKSMQVETKAVSAPADLDGLSLLIVDCASTKPDGAMLKAVSKFVSGGGKLLLKNLDPSSLEAWRGLFGFAFHLKESQIEHSQLELVSSDSLLDQATASDFYWFKKQPIATPVALDHKIVYWALELKEKEDRFKVVAVEPRMTLRFWEDSAYWIEGRANACAGVDNAPQITSPGAGVVQVDQGKGAIIIDQTDWDNLRFIKCRSLVRRILLSLKADFLAGANKKVSLDGYALLDLSKLFNTHSTNGLLANSGVRFEEGAKADFSEIPFLLKASSERKNSLFVGKKGVKRGGPDWWDANVAESVKGVPVGLKASSLFFLHSAIYLPKPNATLAEYRINYEDGSSVVAPVVSCQNIGDWFGYPPAGFPASIGMAFHDNGGRYPALLYTMEWKNPNPDKTIKSVDVEFRDETGVLWLAAVTAKKSAK